MRSEHVGYPIFGVSGLVNLGPAQPTPQWRNAKNAKSQLVQKLKKDAWEEMMAVLCFLASETHPLFSEFHIAIIFKLFVDCFEYSHIQSSWHEQIISTDRSSLHNHQCNPKNAQKNLHNKQKDNAPLKSLSSAYFKLLILEPSVYGFCDTLTYMKGTMPFDNV